MKIGELKPCMVNEDHAYFILRKKACNMSIPMVKYAYKEDDLLVIFCYICTIFILSVLVCIDVFTYIHLHLYLYLYTYIICS